MLWVKGTVLTLMESSQPLCWPRCLQCNLEAPQRADPAVQRCLNIYQSPTKQSSLCLSVCSNPSSAAVSQPGWVQMWHQVSWLAPGRSCGSFSQRGLQGHRLPVVPPAPQPLRGAPAAAQLLSRFSPLPQWPWRQRSSSSAPCWCRRPWQTVGDKSFQGRGDSLGDSCSDPGGLERGVGQHRVPVPAGGLWGSAGRGARHSPHPPCLLICSGHPKEGGGGGPL